MVDVPAPAVRTQVRPEATSGKPGRPTMINSFMATWVLCAPERVRTTLVAPARYDDKTRVGGVVQVRAEVAARGKVVTVKSPALVVTVASVTSTRRSVWVNPPHSMTESLVVGTTAVLKTTFKMLAETEPAAVKEPVVTVQGTEAAVATPLR